MRTDWYTFRILSLPQLAMAVILMLSFSLLSIAARHQAIDLAGAPLDPFKQARSKVLVLVFVRTDCPISNRYAPLIQELSAKYTNQAAFWLVFPDKAETPENIRAFSHEYGYTLPAIRDSGHELVGRGRARVTPEAAVFNAKRELIYHGRIDNLYQAFGRARRTATTHELADAIEAASKGMAPRTAAADGVGCFISDLK